MTYGQHHGGPPYGGQPYGQPPYGGQPQYGPQQYPRPGYALPGHPAPPHDPYAAPEKRRRPETPTGGPVDDEDERWAVPAYVGMFVSGFVAPAIVLAAKGRTSHFARFHAMQALNLFVAMFVCTSLSLLLAYFKGPDWLLLVLLALAADCFFTTRAAIGANRCEWYRLPVLVAWRIFR
ncbi:DUF4870 domain-containing protein [Actinoallomurus iriomotensis]|uniref:DUF4870 domain-containing protein n=1 Tax=Actinoallomurus iriomotensis TaxID=478107 RepID=A0A9W6W5G9_9ACTN|nr:DUF4870 domain-containing protein [Actinoallomurus iriomotensis]GLY90036.1 hypothetical protein Airi02_079650 [Actinoallomurus iriomotensis]